MASGILFTYKGSGFIQQSTEGRVDVMLIDEGIFFAVEVEGRFPNDRWPKSNYGTRMPLPGQQSLKRFLDARGAKGFRQVGD